MKYFVALNRKITTATLLVLHLQCVNSIDFSGKAQDFAGKAISLVVNDAADLARRTSVGLNYAQQIAAQQLAAGRNTAANLVGTAGELTQAIKTSKTAATAKLGLAELLTPSKYKATLALLFTYYMWHRKQLNTIDNDYQKFFDLLHSNSAEIEKSLTHEYQKNRQTTKEKFVQELDNSVARLKNLNFSLLALNIPAGFSIFFDSKIALYSSDIFGTMRLLAMPTYFMIFAEALRLETNDTINDLLLIRDIITNEPGWQKKFQSRSGSEYTAPPARQVGVSVPLHSTSTFEQSAPVAPPRSPRGLSAPTEQLGIIDAR